VREVTRKVHLLCYLLRGACARGNSKGAPSLLPFARRLCLAHDLCRGTLAWRGSPPGTNVPVLLIYGSAGPLLGGLWRKGTDRVHRRSASAFFRRRAFFALLPQRSPCCCCHHGGAWLPLPTCPAPPRNRCARAVSSAGHGRGLLRGVSEQETARGRASAPCRQPWPRRDYNGQRVGVARPCQEHARVGCCCTGAVACRVLARRAVALAPPMRRWGRSAPPATPSRF